jgi:hypothetical protein
MTTFVLDLRLSTLNAAITAAQAAANAAPPVPQAAAWLDALNAGLAALDALPDDQKDDAAFRDATRLWGPTLHSGDAVLAALKADPVFLARGAAPKTIRPVADAFAAFPNRSDVWGSTPGLNSDMVTELEHEAHRWWASQPAETRPLLADAERPLNYVTVLLPVTIETRFYAPDAGHASWRVRVRVSPDDISINRHQPNPTTAELGLLAEVRGGWQAVVNAANAAGTPAPTLDAYLATPDGTALWRRMSNALRPARAAWLLTSTARLDLAAIPVNDTHRPVRVDGFPDRIEVWIVRQGQPDLIGTGAPVSRDDLVFDLPKDADAAWWNSWEKAVALGIGIECDLPGEPEQIETLYVLGVSGESPARLFADKAASGDFAVLEPGAPTNTVHGEPAANLAKDADTWQRLAQDAISLGPDFHFRSGHSLVLTGQADAMPPFPTPRLNFDADGLTQALVGGLYPALWGHTVKDIWGLGKGGPLLGAWLFDWLRPEGPLLPIRSGDQPYGVLPATALRLWAPSIVEAHHFPDLEPVESSMAKAAAILRDSLAEAARGRGTTVDADTGKLVTLVARTPTSVGYSYQPFLPAEVLESLLMAIPGGFDGPRRDKFEQMLRDRYEPGRELSGNDPQRLYVALGEHRDIHMPLVLPIHFDGVPPEKAPFLPIAERVKETIRVLDTLMDVSAVDDGLLKERFRNVLPDSVLFRLLLWSTLLAKADAAQAGLPGTPGSGDGPRLEPPSGSSRPLLYRWTQEMTLRQAAQVKLDTPAGRVYSIVGQSVDMLVKLLQDTLDRAAQAGDDRVLTNLVAWLDRQMRNLLDSAGTRVDPFITALAWRRLSTLANDETTGYRLGIYGWVDAPKRGQPGPLPGGLLHAPSQAQLSTSIILRDRYLAEQGFDGGPGRAWQMSITSRHARMAEEIADEVRLGGHMREILGRRVEAIVGDPVHVQQLRTTIAPLRAASPDRFTVCNGEKVLDLAATGALPLPLSPDQTAQLAEWSAAIDVYADLLVAQGVQQAVTLRADAASGTMNAAAGTGLPPELEVIQTSRSGQTVLTSVLAALPFASVPALVAGAEQDAHPAQLADASVAAYIDATFGPAMSWAWTFHLKGQRMVPGGGPDGGDLVAGVDETRDITLADLGLTPMDAVLYPPDRLRAATAQAARDEVAAGIPNLAQLAVDDTLARPDADRHRLAREVVAALSGRPFEFGRLHLAASGQAAAPGPPAQADAATRQDLLARLAALVSAGKALRDKVLNDAAQASAGLRLALRWGITPIDPAMTPTQRAAQAAASLNDRIEKAEAFLAQVDAVVAAPMVDAAKPNPAGKAPQASIGQIAEAIQELASPEAQIAILSPVDAPQLVNYEPDHPLVPAPRLDEDWLTVLAPVRAPLARLEALQLEPLRPTPVARFDGLTAYVNRPDDPWQTGPVAENRDRTRDPLGYHAFQSSHLIAAYGTADALAGPQVAVGTVDSWTETVPERRHTTQAAFHFNAPGARAAQAVLLAVPPVLDQVMNTEDLLAVVRETRDLAHARTVAMEDLGRWDAVLPVSLLNTPDPWQSVLLDDRTDIPL